MSTVGELPKTQPKSKMKNKRKDIWKVLYNLLNMDEPNMNNVYTFVNEILCKDPSLIRPYSLCENHNHFQDALIFWVVAKFITFLGDKKHENLFCENILLQQQIIRACLLRRPRIFVKLVQAYSGAISELSDKHSAICFSASLELNSFAMEDSRLLKINPGLKIEPIRIRLSDANNCIGALLRVLDYALKIGYEPYPHIFKGSLESVCKALKEFDWNVKELCLNYFVSIFQVVANFDAYFEHFLLLGFQSLVLIQKTFPNWREHFTEITIQLVNVAKGRQAKLLYGGRFFQHAYELLSGTIETYPDYVSPALCRDLIDYMLHIQSHYQHTMFEVQSTNDILKLASKHPYCLRLFAAKTTSSWTDIEEMLLKQLLELLNNTTTYTGDSLRMEMIQEILLLAASVAHRDRLSKQIDFISKQEKLSHTSTFWDCINLIAHEHNNVILKDLIKYEQYINVFIENVRKIESTETKIIALKVTRLLLETSTSCTSLSSETQINLLRLFAEPFSLINQVMHLQENVDIPLVLTAVQEFTSMQMIFTESTKLGNCMKSMITGMLHDLITMSSDKSHQLLMTIVYNNLPNMLYCNFLSSHEIVRLLSVIPISLACSACCLIEGEKGWCLLKISCYDNAYLQIVCDKCDKDAENLLEKKNLVAFLQNKSAILMFKKHCELSVSLLPFQKETIAERVLIDPKGVSGLQHANILDLHCNDILDVLGNGKVYKLKSLHLTMNSYCKSDDNDEFVNQIAKCLLQQILRVLQKQDEQTKGRQLQLLAAITYCVKFTLSEHCLFHFFKMTLFFIIHPNSKVKYEAVLRVNEMCSCKRVKPQQLWNWYKRDTLSLVTGLAIYAYLTKGHRFTRSFKHLTKMLEFSSVQEFIYKYYRILVTLILPQCIQQYKCKGTLIGIAKITRKTISQLFISSFLRTYTQICLYEEPEIANQCLELVVQSTEFSVNQLMNSNVKHAISELIIYFNRNPLFVMRSLHYLILENCPYTEPTRIIPSKSMENVNAVKRKEVAKFIADRFLGIITYFEACLAEPNFEKSLKEEALCSLGQVIRCVGTLHVTQFRFKIMAMLNFVQSIDDKVLQNLCLKVWSIFLSVANIQDLGQSLSCIVASILQLLPLKTKEVNAILESLILRNASILGTYISDLYFIEEMENILPSIRQCVARQTEFLKVAKTSLLTKIQFFFNQISNENMQVRIYGLQNMRKFITKQRKEINNMILNEAGMEPTIENIINTLVSGCRNDDRSLQSASAKCLGELGAIDPSFMPSKYLYEQISLAVCTDDFATMALTNLCAAYQLQKDTKYVDNFSLAIQETLTVCGVSPQATSKHNIWNSLPERMRQIMTPFLTSCYTSTRKTSTYTEHPIFSNMFHYQYEDWAFAWACRLIDCIQTKDVNHLLSSYKPSMRRDNNILTLFLPYIVLHALQEGSNKQKDQIYEEFVAVLLVSSSGPTETIRKGQNACDAKDLVSRELPICFNYESKLDNTYQVRKTSVVDYNTKECISRTCTKLCSAQVDFLISWTRKWQHQNARKSCAADAEQKYQCIVAFLEKLDKLMISKANFFSGEYTRALLYLEDFLESNKNNLQEQISYLIEIYVNLLDSDSVESAVRAKNANLTLTEEILVHRIADHPQEALVCYEQLLSSQMEPLTQEHVNDMIRCYLRMDAPETALLVIDGLWQKLSDHYTDDFFKECKADLFWQLGRYDDLDHLLQDTAIRQKSSNWSVQCANIFVDFRQPNSDLNHFDIKMDTVRSNILNSMQSSSATMDQNTYFHSYDEALKLHLLIEVEKAKFLVRSLIQFSVDDHTNSMLESNKAATEISQVKSFFTDWEARLRLLKPVIQVLEPVFCFRRNVLLELNHMLLQSGQEPSPFIRKISELLNLEIGKLWVKSVQMNLEHDNLQQAHLSLMKAEQYSPTSLFLEKTQLLWKKGDQSGAFKLIEGNLQSRQNSYRHTTCALDTAESVRYSEAKALQAIYHAEARNIPTELNLQYFKEAIACNKNSERCHTELAQYMERIYAQQQRSATEMNFDLVLEIMKNYAISLKYGYENIYQSVPRLLSFWLDTTSQCAAFVEELAWNSGQSEKVKNAKEYIKKMNKLIDNCGTELPAVIFYTAYSQLLSRICHSSTEVYNVLRTLIINLVEHFPQQSLWMLLPILKSSQPNRIKRCVQILHDSRLKKPTFTKLLASFNALAERLIELTNQAVPLTNEVYKLSVLAPQLSKLFENPDFANIMLPFEKYMQATLPVTSSSISLKNNFFDSSEENASLSIPTNPFPHEQIYLSSLSDEIIVIRSAAKPKKIKIKCNDGRTYEILVKPKDDLRKDFRFMEFNGLVKRYLHQDPEARHRRLRIRTYAAIPFNEECGLVEWIPRLNTLRSICRRIYVSMNVGLTDRIIKQYALAKEERIEKKREVFLKTLLPHHPPVFHQWLRQLFASPQCWYEARNACVRTIAVMSMVGYILGLGDRHGENILFDETNGDAVHVDFNCLFNQGELFGFPEVVPFRLTHNMIAAMGPLGVDATYRKSCEITLRLLKRECRTLMSVLRPFVYDMVELTRSQCKGHGRELTDPKAIQNVRRIEERLQGFVQRTSYNSMPLSIDGQVNFLIAEATDVDKLASMYIGWMAYL